MGWWVPASFSSLPGCPEPPPPAHPQLGSTMGKSSIPAAQGKHLDEWHVLKNAVMAASIPAGAYRVYDYILCKCAELRTGVIPKDRMPSGKKIAESCRMSKGAVLRW